MPFQTTDPVNLAEFGLISDKPSNSTPPNAWSDSLNMRVKDDSVQGVLDFIDNFAIDDNFNGTLVDAKPVAVTQWTPAGSDHLNIAYVIESQKTGEIGKGRVFVHNTDTDVTTEITNSDTSAAFTIDFKYPPQMFVFNEILIVNPGTGDPQHITADATTNGNLTPLPGFSALAGTSYPRVMRPYKNRLIAMNWFDPGTGSGTGDDSYHPIDFVWSSNITAISNLAGAQWQAATTNSAGDAFLTATPGKILDGSQLGEDFIVTKSDSLVRVFETGDSLILGFQSLLEDDGAYGTNCIANVGNSQQIIMGNYGVYIHDGRGDKQDIAKGIFQDALFADIKDSERDRTFVFLQTRDKEVWFCYSSKTNTGGGCDTAYVFNYKDSKTYKRSLPNVTSIHEAELAGILEIYAAAPGTKQIQLLDPTALVSGGFIELSNKPLGGTTTSRDVLEVHIISGNPVKFSMFGDYSPESSTTFPTPQTFVPSTDYKLNVRENGKYFSFRFDMDSTTNPMLTAISLHIRDVGRR